MIVMTTAIAHHSPPKPVSIDCKYHTYGRYTCAALSLIVICDYFPDILHLFAIDNTLSLTVILRLKLCCWWVCARCS